MRPQPICATWIFLLGASAPSSREGMKFGSKTNPAAPRSEVLRKERREERFILLM
jgi:hypothetical protein